MLGAYLVLAGELAHDQLVAALHPYGEGFGTGALPSDTSHDVVERRAQRQVVRLDRIA